jgi:hypothetical protein
MNRRRASVLSVLAVLLLLMTGLVVSSAQASTTNIVSIPSGLDACNGVAQDVGLTKHEGGFEEGVYNTFGKNYPVILVHGFAGKNQGQWGDLDESTDLAAKINEISNATVAIEFQYSFTLLGRQQQQRLANAIHCMATISRGNNGPGKVIVVGYSEGSTLAHGAASLKSTDGAYAIGDEIGQAVTIADARVVFGARNFPSGVTVHSIGRDISNATRNNDGSFAHVTDTRSDGAVNVAYATAQSTSDAGGGTFIASCYQEYSNYTQWLAWSWYSNPVGMADCRHGNLLRVTDVQLDIVAAITAFVNAHCVSAEPSDSPMRASLTADPTPPPVPTDTSTPGEPPTGDPTGQPTPPPTTPPSGCTA